jgi:hypothetical protein
MPRNALPSTVGEWENLAVTVEVNAHELAYLAETRTQLVFNMDSAKAASIRQAAFKSQFQQATRDLEGFLTQGRDLATRLRNGIRTQYGLKSEKLVEFGLQPRRKRTRTKKEEPGPAATPAPTGSTASNSTASDNTVSNNQP